jgi:glycerol-3-phosphate acyltransferase PlsY
MRPREAVSRGASGAPGGVGIATVLGAEALLVPIAFVAVTVTAWVVLFSSPAIEHVVMVAPLVVHVAPLAAVAV